MAKSKRSFEGRRKGTAFKVETILTDTEAIKRLQGLGGDFAQDCAKAIHNMAGGFEYRENLVAWGFKLAEENAVTKKIRIHPSILGKVAERRPQTLTIGDETVKIAVCGARSKYQGQYNVSNGLHYYDPQNRFYGRATPNGELEITAPAPIVSMLEKGE